MTSTQFTGFEVTTMPDGDTVIICDKWFASALKAAVDTSAAQAEISESRQYAGSNTYEMMINALDQVESLPTVDDLSDEQREELGRTH